MSLLRRVIGGVLRRVRLRQGRTLREVAAAAGVSLPYLSEVERGRKEASSEVLAAICRALGINLSDLLEEARDELRRVERRVPATSASGPARFERVPAARGDTTGPRLRIGFHAEGPAPDASTSRPYVGGATLAAADQPLRVDRLGVICHVGGTTLGGPALSVAGASRHVGASPGGTGLRVRLIPSAPGRPRPRTSGALVRRRARAGRRRLIAV